VQRHRAEGQRAVGVLDDRDLTRATRREELGRGVEQQPVGGVDRDQVRRIDVRLPRESPEQGRRVDPAPPPSQAMEALPAFLPSERR
jgi:hypothetical protein